MKNKFINKNLYIEGLHQLKNPFIITLVIMFSSSILFPILYLSDYYSDYSYFSYYYDNIFRYNYFLAIIPYICAPIFAFLIYSFLFKRKSSDFYHSLSFKRTTLFVSFTASAATMLTVLVLISTLTTFITIDLFLLIKTNGIINSLIVEDSFYSSIIPTALNLIAASMLTVSGIAIGCAVSGRFFSALVTAAIILFCPRIFIGLIISAFKSTNYIIDNNYFNIPLGNDYNALTGAFLNDYSEYKSVIYSLILALIYFVIAAIIFNKRKSETAANMSMSKVPQAIVRIVFSMIFCIPATLTFYTDRFTDNKSTCLILWFFGIIAYFLFEIITQRSVKTLLRALIQFVFVIILNIAILGGLYLGEYAVEAYNPDEKSLQSVKIAERSYYSDYFDFFIPEPEYYYDDEDNYQNYQNIENYEIKNDKIEKILCEALKTTEEYSDYYSSYDYEFTVCFKDNNGSVKYRNVALTQTEMNNLCYELAKDNGFFKAATTFPKEASTVDIDYVALDDIFNFNSMTEPKCIDVYNKAIEEINNYIKENKNYNMKRYLTNFYMSNNDIYMDYYNDFDENLGSITITDKQGNLYDMPILPDMSETVEMITDLAINSNENKADINSVLNIFENDKWSVNILYINTQKSSNNTSNSFDTFSCEIKNHKKTEEFKEYIKNNGLKKQENSVIIEINMYQKYEDDDYYPYNCYFYLDKTAFEKYLEPTLLLN